MKNSKRSVTSNIEFLVKMVWKWDKKLFFYFGLYTIVTAIVPFINIFTLKFLLDELMGSNRSVWLITILLSYAIISAALNYFNAYLEGAYAPRLTDIGFKFSNLMNEKCMKMDFKYTEDTKTLNDIETAYRAVSGTLVGIEGVLRKLFGLFGAVITFFGYITIVVNLSLYILFYLIANVVIIYYLTIRVKKYEYRKKDSISKLKRKSDYIYDIMCNFAYGKDVRIFDLSKIISNKFQYINMELVKIHKDIKYKDFRVTLVDTVLSLIREGGVYAYLTYKVLYDHMSIGNFTLYFAIIGGVAAWMQKILDDVAHINSQNLYINDYRNFLETDLKIDTPNCVDIPKEENYEIEFKNVSFRYPNSERYIFKNLYFKINKGESLAIVGANGSGKTTFIKLITKLYEPTEGEILLNGVNISKFSKDEYYKLFSVVFQEIKMYAFSIAENIALKDTDKINREKVAKSVYKSGMKEKIDSLEKGIDTSLLKILDSTGIELSGGENQKLAIARALYKDGPIVILDEPTASLDPIGEYNVYKSFNDMIVSKTSLFISHRLASTQFCDVIAFFENGEIKEYGTHNELLNKNEKYAEMFNVQASYYKDANLASEGA